MTDLDDLKTIASNTDNWDGKKDTLNWAVAEITRLNEKLDKTKEALKWIDNVSAMDYEYVKVARQALEELDK